MRSDDSRIRRETVDGQVLLVPSEEAWAELMREPRLDGRPLGVGRLLQQFRSVAGRTDDVVVALGRTAEAHQPWVLYHLVSAGGRLRRVVVESQTCWSCGWIGLTGNPRDLALYEGTAQPLQALQSAATLPVLSCADCNAPLSRPAIWLQTVRSTV